MRLTFGMHVGAWRGPGSQAHLGQPVLSRPALLGLLETHLGLTAAPVSAARRAAAYLLALRAADTAQRFFHSSLEADEVGTATHLLKWRDELMLAGWDGDAHAGWPQRLLDLAAVEQHANGSVPASEGERLERVCNRLQTRRIPVTAVTLLDPVLAFPARWQDVLSLLPTELAPAPAAAGDTALARVQTACVQAVAQGQVGQRTRMVDDGSVTVLRPTSCEVAMHWLANHCRSVADSSRLFVAEEGAPAVDDTLRIHGQPACGFDAPSVLRPALQALPLALETLWEPVQPDRLLEFLVHPIGPVHLTARRALARAFAKQPGVGGREWTKAREEIAQNQGSQVIDQVTYWLESARHSRAGGAPLDAIIERVSRLQAGLKLRLDLLAAKGSDPYLVKDVTDALGQTAYFIEGLQELRRAGNTMLRPRALEQLTAHATADCSNPFAVAQVGCMQSATAPAACGVERADEVIWWMPSRPKLPPPHPWVRQELEAISAAGIRLRDPTAEMETLMAHWVRPILAARQRLILVLPPEGTEDHPAWQLLRASCADLQPKVLEAHAAAQERLVVTPAQPLRAARGLWNLDPNASWRPTFSTPTRRPVQSFTSLEMLFNNPALAVLADPAHLEAGTTLAVHDDNRMLGKLSHRLLEMLFGEEGSLQWEEPQLDAWLDPAIPALLRREGLPLLAAGAATRLHQFRDCMRRSIAVLLAHLRHAQAVRVEAERALKGDIGGLATEGEMDLLVHLVGGGTVALDLKWSIAGPYRERLAQGDFLQLALYAHMVEQELGSPVTAVGFFTLADATLLTPTPNLFAPGARVVPTPMTTGQLVRAAIDTWNWRAWQWEQGEVDVVGDGLEPPPSQPPDGCLPRRPLPPWHADLEALFGPREGA